MVKWKPRRHRIVPRMAGEIKHEGLGIAEAELILRPEYGCGFGTEGAVSAQQAERCRALATRAGADHLAAVVVEGEERSLAFACLAGLPLAVDVVQALPSWGWRNEREGEDELAQLVWQAQNGQGLLLLDSWPGGGMRMGHRLVMRAVHGVVIKKAEMNESHLCCLRVVQVSYFVARFE